MKLPQFGGEAMRELWLFLLKDFEILMMSSMTCQSNLVNSLTAIGARERQLFDKLLW